MTTSHSSIRNENIAPLIAIHALPYAASRDDSRSKHSLPLVLFQILKAVTSSEKFEIVRTISLQLATLQFCKHLITLKLATMKKINMNLFAFSIGLEAL